jgi:cytosine/adenosine deaminase-related metal-dependent hydrolase
MTETLTLTARYIFPVAGPPLERGTVTIIGERISAVLAHGARTADVDLGNVAILPGLVNAHTHLDLSGACGVIPPTPDFTQWLRGVIAYRRSRTAEEVQQDIRAGMAESLKFGTTLLGDIASEGTSWTTLVESPVRAIVFYELLGLKEERAMTSWEALKWWLASLPRPENCRAGVSPHSPYSTRASSFLGANKLELPLATHLAETKDEQDLLADRRGPLVAFLKDVGAWDPEAMAVDVNHILRLTNRRLLQFTKHYVPLLYIHCNYLPPSAEVPSNATIVYCPRTHAAFGHKPHPFRQFLERGVRVCLGTDSLASNPDLDILAEARFVHRLYPDYAPATLLRMITLSGAEALGWSDQVGSLAPGKSADLVTVPLPNAESADPYALILDADLPVSAVMFRGAWLNLN